MNQVMRTWSNIKRDNPSLDPMIAADQAVARELGRVTSLPLAPNIPEGLQKTERGLIKARTKLMKKKKSKAKHTQEEKRMMLMQKRALENRLRSLGVDIKDLDKKGVDTTNEVEE